MIRFSRSRFHRSRFVWSRFNQSRIGVELDLASLLESPCERAAAAEADVPSPADGQAADHMSCLCVWLLTSVDQVTAGEATSHLIEASQYHEWTLHDLSVIWKVLLGRGHVRPLLRGFELFQKVKLSQNIY